MSTHRGQSNSGFGDKNITIISLNDKKEKFPLKSRISKDELLLVLLFSISVLKVLANMVR